MQEIPVSVVIPAFNRAGLVGRAIDSVLRQRRLRPAEVIVVDDGSADDTAAVAERHGARVVAHEVNRGLPAGRNSGLHAATQPWIAYLDSDDEWLPHLLETLWPLRSRHAIVAGAGLGRGARPEDDFFAGTWTRRPRVLRSAAPLLACGTFIGPSSILLRRDALLAAGGSDESLPRVGGAEDLDLWCRVLEHGTAVVTPTPVAIYHLAGEGAAEVQNDRLGQLDAFENIVGRYAGRSWAPESVVGRAHGVATWERLRDAQRRGDRARTLSYVGELATQPRALLGAADLVVRRRRLDRRRWLLSHAGLPTAAVMPGVDEAERERRNGRDEELVDLRDRGSLAALGAIVRRPPARTYVRTRSQELVARACGSEAVRTSS